MTTVHNPNEACCTIPPVQADYTEKGGYKAHGAFDRVYVTGDNSETALIIVYDIFGYFPQTLQGADILAKTVGAQVFMPDFFGEGNAFPFEKYPPKDGKTKKEIQDFFGGIATPPGAATRLVDYAHVLKGQGFKKIGAIGFCWGGKVVTLGALKEGNPLDAISIVHPVMISPQDAEGLSIPLGLYVSKDEPRDEFDKVVSVLSKKSYAAKVDSKYYSNMFHGWAAARGNLSDPENKREYEDLYSRASAFFKNALA
jgi:dienelactone hydrolase